MGRVLRFGVLRIWLLFASTDQCLDIGKGPIGVHNSNKTVCLTQWKDQRSVLILATDVHLV
jgi:hypothetical protein